MTIRHGCPTGGDGARRNVQWLVAYEVDFADHALARLHQKSEEVGRSPGVLPHPLTQMGEPARAERIVPPRLTGRSRSHRPAPGRFQRAALAYDGVPVPLHAAVRWDRHVIRLGFGGQLPEMSLSSYLRLRLLGFATWWPAGTALVTLVEQAQGTSRPSQVLPTVVSSHR
jgi:hypothetical protein